MIEVIAVTAITSGSTVLVALIGKSKWDSWRGNGRLGKLEGSFASLDMKVDTLIEDISFIKGRFKERDRRSTD